MLVIHILFGFLSGLGFFDIFRPVSTLGPCCAENSIRHLFLSAGTWRILSVKGDNLIWYHFQNSLIHSQAQTSKYRFFGQVKLFGLLCFVLFISSDFCESPVSDICFNCQVVLISLSYSGKMLAGDNLYSSLLLFCF